VRKPHPCEPRSCPSRRPQRRLAADLVAARSDAPSFILFSREAGFGCVRIVNREANPPERIVAVPDLCRWWAGNGLLVDHSVKPASGIVHVSAVTPTAARASRPRGGGNGVGATGMRGHHCRRRRSWRGPPPEQRAERRRLVADALCARSTIDFHRELRNPGGCGRFATRRL
jgi:hypothetical protein